MQAISLCPIPNHRWDSLGTRTQNPSPESLFGQYHLDFLRPSWLPQQEAKPLEAGKKLQGSRCSRGPMWPPICSEAILDSTIQKEKPAQMPLSRRNFNSGGAALRLCR